MLWIDAKHHTDYIASTMLYSTAQIRNMDVAIEFNVRPLNTILDDFIWLTESFDLLFSNMTQGFFYSFTFILILAWIEQTTVWDTNFV